MWANEGKADERPCYVVLPRGAHPTVESFLGLHQNLFPIRRLKWCEGRMECGIGCMELGVGSWGVVTACA